MGVYPAGGGVDGGGVKGGGDLRLPLPEHTRTVHCNQYIVDLCLAVDRRPGSWIYKRWWEQ